MTANELRTKYLEFFKSKGHTIIPSASLLPSETDASTLFTTAGMHPLVPYLLGEPHPGGKRVADVQKCVRTGDIDDVGDNRHCTFFEMMGNWSFGDYFKKEAIEWSFEFLTDEKWLGLDKNRLYVTVFKGEDSIPRDEDAIEIWKQTFKKAGISNEVAGENEIIQDDVRIIPLGIDDNFWIAGATGPCGGDTEMFYDVRSDEEREKDGPINGKFSQLVDSGKIIEVWNDVFMEFNKTAEGKYEKLAKPNVDTGMGVERTLMVLEGQKTVFETELFEPLFAKISELSGKYYDENLKEFRIVADHIKAATFIIADGVTPSNTGAGYVLRRLIRRAVRYGKLLGIEKDFTVQISEIVIQMYAEFYPEIKKQREIIFEELKKEEQKFGKTLENGLRALIREVSRLQYGELHDKDSFLLTEHIPIARMMHGEKFSGKVAFDLYQTHGFPLELTVDELKRIDSRIEVDIDEYEMFFKKHQELSRTASAGMFKGGLQESGEETKKLHTATHLLLAALRQLFGEEIYQKGSNITPERLRFDFNFPEKLTSQQIKQIEDLVNEKIAENIPVQMMEMSKEEALKIAKVSFDPSKYGDTVKVYKIGDFSIELCGGPHIENTSELGHFKIQKEEASSSGVRRIKAVLE